MHVGMATIFQNPENRISDRQVYRNDLRLAELAEPLGFQSVWGVEHHFTDYTMCPDVLQFLSYMAGRTEHIQLGSMVVVLPWHDPIRVAEEVSMLDHLSNGRLVLGVGRGLGRVEFDGFRLKMDESRARFVEYAQMILEGLEKGHCEYQGTYIQQPARDIRPKPFKTFRGRTYAAAVSPESSRIMAELGIGILIIPQKPWDAVAEELGTYGKIFREVNGAEPPPPICAGWTLVHEDEDRARELAYQYVGGYWKTVLKHYELQADHLKDKIGYEYYAEMQRHAREDADAVTEFFLSLQPWGTPEQVYEKIMDIRSRVGNEAFTGVFSYAGMPPEEAERNMRLFAREVMPELKKVGVETPDFAARASATD